jgi:methyltransferase (TIGR00027 family)
LAAAAFRAAHQAAEGGRIFADPLALPILGGEGAARVEEAARPEHAALRIFIAVRSRFAEDSLRVAVVERGVGQFVILGAGLDTYAYRSEFGSTLRVFEVDHPDTQAWKRERLAAAAIAVPDWLIYAAIDFERETLADALAKAGFDASKPAFFTWLGVIPYLTEDAIRPTLGYIGALPNGSEVVFDYGDPPETLAPEMRAYLDARAARASEADEPWVTFFSAAEIREKLLAAGFYGVEDLGPRRIAERYFPGRATSRERGGHVARAYR